MLAVGQTIVNGDNEYQIQSHLGRAKFVYTYKATKVGENTHCVIKHLNPLERNLRQTGLKLFDQEAQKLRQIEHPQIPKFIAFFEQEGEYYLIHEYIDGHDLSEEIKIRKDETYVIKLLKDVLNILIFIHDRGIIHANIAPGNLLKKKTKEIVLIDFGSVKLAKSENDENEQSTQSKNHPYSPKEQYQNQVYKCSDIYSLDISEKE